MRKFLHKTLTSPQISIVLRKIVENNFRKQKQTIKQYFSVTPSDTILDVGCGTGEFSVFFPSHQYTGVDIDPANVNYATKHYHGTFLVADGKHLPFADASFSKVVVIGVFHHLSAGDTTAVLAEIKRVWKPDGKFLVMEDTKTTSPLTQLMQYFDQGEFIRSADEWNHIFSNGWVKEQHFTFKNGICFYSTFLLHK